MIIPREHRRLYAQQLVIFFLLSIVMSFFLCRECVEQFKENKIPFLFSTLYNYVFWVFLGIGNGIITDLLDGKVSWTRQTGLRFFLAVITTFGYSGVVILLVVNYLPEVFGFSMSEAGKRNAIIYAFIILAVVALFLNGRGFLLAWKRTAVAEEKLKAEKLKIQYDALRAQVNPHFLFNSFNVLTSLIELNQKKAIDYVEQMSDIMRYVMDARKKDVVTIEEELDFTGKYLYLNQLRFGDALHYVIAFDEKEPTNYFIVPLALQLLVENAIKHNELTKEDPLKIKIYGNTDYLFVENNFQPKSQEVKSNKFGLSNLKERYAYLADREVLVEQNEEIFKVGIPTLLELKGDD